MYPLKTQVLTHSPNPTTQNKFLPKQFLILTRTKQFLMFEEKISYTFPIKFLTLVRQKLNFFERKQFLIITGKTKNFLYLPEKLISYFLAKT